MPSKLSSSQTPDVNQLKKMMNNRKMANLAAAAAAASGQLPTSLMTDTGNGSPSGNGGLPGQMTNIHLTHPMIRKTSGGGISSDALLRSHHRLPSDPEVVSRIITFGSMPSYREDKMQEFQRHKDTLMRSKSIESNLSPSSDGKRSLFSSLFSLLSSLLFSSSVHSSDFLRDKRLRARAFL